eukprot:6216965-Prymnesium_polylepis.1
MGPGDHCKAHQEKGPALVPLAQVDVEGLLDVAVGHIEGCIAHLDHVVVGQPPTVRLLLAFEHMEVGDAGLPIFGCVNSAHAVEARRVLLDASRREERRKRAVLRYLCKARTLAHEASGCGSLPVAAAQRLTLLCRARAWRYP